MNRSPETKRQLHDADTARSIYQNNIKHDKKRIFSIISLFCVIALVAVLAVIGVARTFSGSHATYREIVSSIITNSKNTEGYVLSKNELALNKKWDKASEYISDKLNSIYSSYCEGNTEYSEVTNIVSAFSQLDEAKRLCEEKIQKISAVENGRKEFEKAKELRVNGKLAEALVAYLKVSPEDKLNYKTAIEKAKELEAESGDQLSLMVNEYLCKFDIDGARSFVSDLSSKLGESDFLTAEIKRIDDYYTEQTDLVTFNGPVEHLFTHCLIAFPEICYSSPSMTASLDEDCITPSEFKKILQALYEKDYILIDINTLITENENGTEFAEIKVPRGKTPFVFSVDDVTYDSRKMHTGMVDKLIVDESGRVCTYTLHEDGSEVISYDNECFPIIDEFVRQHPDFTFQGARGILCHTGFDGVFGYRTQKDPKEDVDSETEIEGAKKVAEALKNEGWTFASHSYAHAHMSQMDLESVKDDTDSWIEEVTPIIGETKVMVWPYGDFIREGDRHEYIYEAGFRIFCGVGVKPYMTEEPDGLGVFMDRKALDGYSLRNRRDKYLYLFDTEEVWDPLRPKTVTW